MRELPFTWDAYVTLDEVKLDHLRLDAADTDEDNYVTALISTALQQVTNDIDREIYPEGETIDPVVTPDAIYFNDALRHAVYLLCGHWFEHRESVTLGVNATKTPHAYSFLIHPYMNNGFISFYSGEEEADDTV